MIYHKFCLIVFMLYDFYCFGFLKCYDNAGSNVYYYSFLIYFVFYWISILEKVAAQKHTSSFISKYLYESKIMFSAIAETFRSL